MKTITKGWRKWVVIPLAVVLVMGTVSGVLMTRDTSQVAASGVTASGVTLTGSDPDNDFTYIQFDIGWDYSWHDAVNWDAVWVFAKYKKTGGDGAWHHVHLDTSGHSVTADNGVAATIDAASDGMGVFMYRTSESNGSNDWDGVKLKWPYGAETGETLGDYDKVTVRVFAIEMVYIPQASFYVGDADKDQSKGFYKYGTTGPFQITSEGAINMGETADYLWAKDGGYIETATLPAAFPKGYDAFYCMKYEISQRQYAEFLNALTQAQQETRTGDTLSAEDAAGHYVMIGEDEVAVEYRQGIKAGSDPADGQPYTFGCDIDGDGNFNESNDGEWIAANYLSWADGLAYADWAGLRPMTELEFEKICRGDQAVVDDEYAWGSTSITQATGISNANQNSEVSSNAANAVYGNHGSVQGPLRVGGLTSASDTREQAGASYYGVMEMSGNLFERAVTLGNSTGRAFTGSHGNGVLTSGGDADVANWPGTDSEGSGFRGGPWSGNEDHLRVSNRYYAVSTYTLRGPYYGFRLIRIP